MTRFGVSVDTASVAESLEDTREQWTTEREYIVGTDVEYAVHLEFGRGPVKAQDAEALRFKNESGDVIYRTSVSGHPPYPFFRPALRELDADPGAFIATHTNTSLADIDSGDGLVKALAFALERAIAQNANAGGAVDRSPGTDPEHPKIQTGNLVNSISATRIR